MTMAVRVSSVRTVTYLSLGTKVKTIKQLRNIDSRFDSTIPHNNSLIELQRWRAF